MLCKETWDEIQNSTTNELDGTLIIATCPEIRHQNHPSIPYGARKTVRLCVSLPMRLLWRLGQAMLLCASPRDKISKTNLSPLLDRIDMHIEIPRVDYEKLSGDREGGSARHHP